MKRIFSAILLAMLLTSMLYSTFKVMPVKAVGTIYIRADGSIDPPSAAISRTGNLYTFTADVVDTVIVVERDNVVVDGADHTVTGSGSGNGITLTGRSNVTVRNMTIKNYYNGIYLFSSSYCVLSGNNVTANDWDGIALWLSSSCSLFGNVMGGNQYNFGVYGFDLSDYLHSIDSSNLVDGKPVYYFVNQSDLIVNAAAYPKVGYLGFVNCANVTVQGLNLASSNSEGLLLAFTSNSKITSNNVVANSFWGGIYLYSSSYCVLSGNNAANNTYGINLSYSSSCNLSGNNVTNNSGGIYLAASFNCSLVGNNAVNNMDDGIYLDGSSNNCSLVGNNVTYNTDGIRLNDSFNCSLSGNNATNNTYGICLDNDSFNCSLSGNNVTNNTYGIILVSSNCILVGNNVANSWYGIYLWFAFNNSIFHNNFVNNAIQVCMEYSSGNRWDDRYPSGGNFWSNYTGVDLFKGPYQNILGSDSIGDTPHILSLNNKDNYPFINPDGWKNTKLDFSLTPNPAYVGQIVTMLGRLTDYAGNPIGNTKVDIYVNKAFSGNLPTNASGWFKATATVGAKGTFNITVTYVGSKSHNPSSHTETLVVNPKIDTKVMFSLTPNPATMGQTVTLKGNLTDANGNPIGNAPVELYLKVGAGPWQFKANLTTSSSGLFQAAGKVTSTGTYQIKVLYKGSYKYNQSYSIETLTVNPSMVSEIASTEAHWLKTG